MPNEITNYSGTIYEIGDVIPNYVDSVYTPHVWYDQSKRYKSFNNVFDKLIVSETLLLGDSEDGMWNIEEILEEMLKYLNLHIVQHGYDYYIFDWETAKTDSQVIWLDIFTGDTYTASYSTINFATSQYASNDTQLTVADVFNQISVKDDVTEMDDVLFSPFDSDQLQDITYPQKYVTEYAAPGEGVTAFNTFYNMIKNNVVPDVNDFTTAYKKNWYLKIKKANDWEFLTNGQSIYSYLPIDGVSGKYHNQWALPKHIFDTPFTAAILSFGAGDEFNKNNAQEHENVSKFDDYICINVGGNGADEKSTHSTSDVYDAAPTQFPQENDLKNCGLEIRYKYSTDGNYSPATEDVHNYIVFSGNIWLTTPHECTGGNGSRDGNFIFDKPHGFVINTWNSIEDVFNNITNTANDPSKGGNYVDWMVFRRKNNTLSMIDNWSIIMNTARSENQYKCVANTKNDDGAYYGLLFYDTEYPEYTADNPNGEHANRTLTNLMPPFDRNNWSKRFKYSFDSHSYLESTGTDYDIIPCVDVLSCQLQIGDMYCCERQEQYIENGIKFANKVYEWKSEQELYDAGEYDVMTDGSIRYRAYINLSMNIDNGQFVIGEEHEMWNNIKTQMGLKDKKGIAIPLPYDKHLSGQLIFTIFGPVNNATWNNGIRRHSTWFRHTQVTENVVSILPHVGQIWLKNFKAELCSDRGKNVEFNDADIVYRSDEQKKYINKKDDIEFKFTTALTALEAATMQVNISNNRSDITDDTGEAILSITDNHTLETDKPEKIYVDAYYREHCVPRTILETTVHDGNNINSFNKYRFGFMNDKTYYMMAEEKNLATNTTKIKFKER